MRYQTGTAFRRALETRIAERAADSGVSIQRLRKAVAFERLLARLLIVAPNRWMLKGGLALDFRIGARARATKDMDLAHCHDPAGAATDLISAGHHDLDDYFSFTISQTDDLDALQDDTAVRYRVQAALGGRAFENMVVDIGLMKDMTTRPETLTLPDFLAFAEIPPITVPTIPLTQHVAEKLHAYTRKYGDGTRFSSREKDLVDLVVISTFHPFVARDLFAALLGVFAIRGTHPLPSSVPPPPTTWGVVYRKLAVAVGIDPSISEGRACVAAFLDPLLSFNPPLDAVWDPANQLWLAPSEGRSRSERRQRPDTAPASATRLGCAPAGGDDWATS
jgi:hypothetical protein